MSARSADPDDEIDTAAIGQPDLQRHWLVRASASVRSLVGTRARRINLRPQLVEDGSQGPNAIADGVLGSTDELDRLDGQDGIFLFDSSGFSSAISG